uniref:aldo/keto reductase n=1 Tax=Candidatus Cryptobacteroides bacterium TaxID=3085639 RepID=UPI003FF0244A
MSGFMDRRDFLKTAGAGALAVGTTSFTGCSFSSDKRAEVSGDAEMQMRTSPKNGEKVSLLGYGCMRWPMKKGADGKDHIDQEAVNEMVDYAYRNGVNYYDTSPAYLQGQSEEAAGIALSRYPRESYYIATKLSNFNNFSREAGLKMYRDSQKALRTDYFDYYLLHAIGTSGFEGFEERYINNGLLDFLLEEREAGRIRNLGFSFHGRKEVFDRFMELHEKYHWDFVQIEMNYVDWEHAKVPENVNADYLYEELAKRNIPATIMEPLLGGRLAKLPDAIAERMKEREPQMSIASWAFRFCGSYPNILTVLSGMSSMDPLIENVETFSHFRPLNDEEIAFLMEMANLMEDYPTVPCNACSYCMPCPYGIDIPTIFRHYNDHVNSGEIAQSCEQDHFQRLKRRYLVSYDRAVETVRQADHCIGCGQCRPKCPQSIDIPRALRHIDRYVEKLKRETL